MNEKRRRFLQFAGLVVAVIAVFSLGGEAFAADEGPRFNAVANQGFAYFMNLDGCDNAGLSKKYISSGNHYRKKKDFKKAIDYFKNAIDQCSQNPMAFLMTGTAYSERGKHKMASDAGTARIILKDSVKWIEHALKILQSQNNEFLINEMSLEDVRNAKLLCYYNLASSYQELGKTKKYNRYLDKARALKGNQQN